MSDPYATVTLTPEEQFNPQYCPLCDQTFFSIGLLNMHLNHSGQHPYCQTCRRGFLKHKYYRAHLRDQIHSCEACGRHFNSAKALQIHNEQSVYHSRDYERGARETRPEGWEDAMTDELPPDNANAKSMPRIQFGAALLNLKRRLTTTASPRRRCAV